MRHPRMQINTRHPKLSVAAPSLTRRRGSTRTRRLPKGIFTLNQTKRMIFFSWTPSAARTQTPTCHPWRWTQDEATTRRRDKPLKSNNGTIVTMPVRHQRRNPHEKTAALPSQKPRKSPEAVGSTDDQGHQDIRTTVRRRAAVTIVEEVGAQAEEAFPQQAHLYPEVRDHERLRKNGHGPKHGTKKHAGRHTRITSAD